MRPDILYDLVEFSLGGAIFFLPFSKSAAEIFIFTGLGLWLLEKARRRQTFPSLGPTGVSYALFLLITLISLTQAAPENFTTGLRGLFKWLKYIGLFFLSVELFEDPKRAGRLLCVFLASILFLCVNGFYQVLTGADLVKHYSVDIPGRLVRMRSSMPSPNDLATFLMFAIPLSFALWGGRKRWDARSLLAAAAFGIFSLCFVMTLSRAAFFSLLAAAFLYMLVRRKFSALGSAVLFLGIFSASGILRENFLSIFDWHDRTIAERLRYWHNAWLLVAQRPLLGHGVNLFTLKFSSTSAAGTIYRGYAHNCYLQMWSEIGIFGLAAFLLPFFLALVEFIKRKSRAEFRFTEAMFVGLVAFFIQGFFDTQFYAYQTSVLFWTFWGAYHAEIKTRRDWDSNPGTRFTRSIA